MVLTQSSPTICASVVAHKVPDSPKNRGEYLFDQTKAVYKMTKLGSAICNGIGLARGAMEAAPIASSAGRAFNEVGGLISPLDCIGQINYFVSGQASVKGSDGQLKNGIFKSVKMAFLFFSKGAESALWASRHGLVQLGSIANKTGAAVVASFKNKMTIFACSSSIIDSIIQLSKEAMNKDRVKSSVPIKHCLNLVDEAGKITLTLASAYWFSVPFTLVAIITATAGLTKEVISFGYFSDVKV